jgi:hypothetical protein
MRVNSSGVTVAPAFSMTEAEIMLRPVDRRARPGRRSPGEFTTRRLSGPAALWVAGLFFVPAGRTAAGNRRYSPDLSVMRYKAHAVDVDGVSRAVYEFESANDQEAKYRAEGYLEAHPTIEVWEGVRRVARLTRDEA